MRDACIKAVAAALGRELSQNEIKDIETRIARYMRLLARENPSAWSAKSQDERLAEAGKTAAKELAEEARRKVRNLEMRILRKQALNDFVAQQVAEGRDDLNVAALDRILAPKADAKGGPIGGSVDQISQGIYADGVAAMQEAFEAGKRRGLWQFIPFTEPGTNAILRRALAGLDAPAEFKAMAKAVHDHIEILRQRYNAAGGTVGKLEDWGEPHRWSDVRVVKAIKKRGRSAVVDDFVNAARRDRYINEDGSLFTPEQLREFMDRSLDTILTDGANKRLAGTVTPGINDVANRHRAHREIHLRPDAIEKMLDAYSEMNAMESLNLHLRSLARDIAIIETFGPNADISMKQMIDEARDRDVVNRPDRKETVKGYASRVQARYDYLAGNVENYRNLWSIGGQAIRSWSTFTSLGMTVWSSMTDPVNMQHVAHARGLSHGKLWLNDVAQFTGTGRRWAKRAGLITDTVTSYADRFGFDHLLGIPDVAGKAASFTLKATGLNWVTEARRAAWGMTMMDALGHLVRYTPDFRAMKESDAAIVKLLNIDENVWRVWRLAKLETRGQNQTLLSPQSIYAIDDARILELFPDQSPALVKQRAVTSLLGIVKDETNTAVITAGARERATMLKGTQGGTFTGELMRSIVLFRSYPWTFMTRQWNLAKSVSGGGHRAAYAASLFVTLWLTGIISNWIQDILNGRDPRSINPSHKGGVGNLGAGLVKGGGAGFLGDFFMANADPGNRSQSLTSGLAGPVLSKIDEVQSLTLGNINQAMRGEETNFGPEAVKFASRNMAPNWWYTKALTDRYAFGALQEEMEPGYTAKLMNRQRNANGTEYFWPLDEPLPTRAPNGENAISE